MSCRRTSRRVVLLGMGSSAYAGGVAAARMRARGLVASSELASSQLLPDWDEGTLVVATSASGGSAETLDALDRLPGSVHTVALTNTAGLGHHAAVRRRGGPDRRARGRWGCLPQLPAHAGPTAGPRMPPRREPTRMRLRTAVALSADASAYLLDTESDWRLEVSEPLLGPSGIYLAAPAHRLLLGAAGRPDAARGSAGAGGRMRDRRLEPCRRLPDQDHRLPAAGVRRIAVGSADGRVDDAARQHRRRRRRRRCRQRSTTCAIQATPTTLSGY